LHRRRKEEAKRHYLALTRQALVLLEQALSAQPRKTAELRPNPLKPATVISSADIIRELCLIVD